MNQLQPIPAVSIVIPVYNREKEIQRGLESLANQTFDNFEVLVCDDGSTDATEAVVAAFPHKLRIQYIKGPHEGGPAGPRNRGWKQAKAPFVAFLDSDDWWMPQKLEKSIPLLEAGADIVYHPLIKVSESGYSIHRGHFLPERSHPR